METISLEVYAGEGGMDAKLFVHELLSAYVKYAKRLGLSCELTASEEGMGSILIKGPSVQKIFQDETGKHCVQRIPPTERYGRTQTSMVTVGVFLIRPLCEVKLSETEFEFQFTKGSGPGGQHRNKTSSTVRMTHKPTGLRVVINGRSQHQNRALAYEILCSKVRDMYEEQKKARDRGDRSVLTDRSRGNKIRTYNLKEQRAVDHRTGAKTRRVEEVLDGRFELLTGNSQKKV